METVCCTWYYHLLQMPPFCRSLGRSILPTGLRKRFPNMRFGRICEMLQAWSLKSQRNLHVANKWPSAWQRWLVVLDPALLWHRGEATTSASICEPCEFRPTESRFERKSLNVWLAARTWWFKMKGFFLNDHLLTNTNNTDNPFQKANVWNKEEHEEPSSAKHETRMQCIINL